MNDSDFDSGEEATERSRLIMSDNTNSVEGTGSRHAIHQPTALEEFQERRAREQSRLQLQQERVRCANTNSTLY